MRWALIALVLALAGCAAPPPPAPDASNADTLDIPENGVARPTFGAVVPIRVEVRFVVEQGGPIDAWLAAGEQCGLYGTRQFQHVDEALDVSSGALAGRFDAGDHCLVLDNGPFAKGRAESAGGVRVRYVMDVYEEKR